MDNEPLEDLVRRLTLLVMKIDERDTIMVDMLEELREFNRQQVAINADVRTALAHLDALMTRVFQDRHNGHEA